MVVGDVDKDGHAAVVYSWGEYGPWDIHEPGYLEVSGTIADGKLTLETFSSGANVSYKLSGEKLKGKYVLSGRTSRIKLRKIE